MSSVADDTMRIKDNVMTTPVTPATIDKKATPEVTVIVCDE